MTWLQIKADGPKPFTAAVETREEYEPYSSRVIRAAPIVKYMMGWSMDKVYAYCKTRGWKCNAVCD